MSELAWTAVRVDTIDRFNGQTPRPQDEALIIDIFEAHPQMVLRAIDETAVALAEGKITWAWSVLKARLDRGATAIREATVDTAIERTRHIANAENWIRNAGLHYDRWSDVEADLFGDDYQSGRLRDYDTPELRQRMHDHWLEHRPRGEQAERDHESWNAQCAANRARAAAMLKAKHQPEPEPDDEPTFTPAAT